MLGSNLDYRTCQEQRLAHPAVFVIYGDAAVRDSIRVLLESEGWPVRDLGSLEAFFQIADLTVSGCLVLEDWTAAPGDGLESLIELRRREFTLPAIVASGRSETEYLLKAAAMGGFAVDPLAGIALADAVRAVMTTGSSGAAA
jgi:FixJ family two-component response regulator